MGIFGSVGKSISSFFGGIGATSPPAPNTNPNGGDGIKAYGGYLPTGERNPELIGTLKWTTFANTYNAIIVATAIRYFDHLLSGTKWSCTPNPRGGKDAERGVEIVEQGLIHAQMPKPWAAVAAKQGTGCTTHGFALHEWSIRKRDDGMVVFAELGHRPQYTVDRWDKPSDRDDWHMISQLTRQGDRYFVPRERLFYCVDDTLTDSPDGMGLLRHVVELVKKLGFYEALEALAYSTDLRGLPIATVPIAEIKNAAGAGDGATGPQVDARVAADTQALRTVMSALFKNPESPAWLFIDSDVYHAPDGTPSPERKWGLELLRGDTGAIVPIASAIARVQMEIARLFGVEHVMMGGNSSGSHAMHDSKVTMLGIRLQTTVTRVGDAATRDLARTLVALNGLDPDTCTPTIIGEPVDTESVLAACQALQSLAAAALQPDDPAPDVIRERLRLPPRPEPSPEMMGLMRPRQGPPDPAQGEVDVQVDDLGAEKPSIAPKRALSGR